MFYTSRFNNQLYYIYNIKGSLRYLVMNLLSTETRMYGYEITRVLEERSRGRLRLTFAALYPVLHKLEAEGMMRTETENVNNRIRKYYCLTDAGRKEAGLLLKELREYLEIMTKLTNEQQAPFPGPLKP
jgi:PadR family transcriptional regulator PadR